MPGTYEKGKFDIAGFAVGIVESKKILNNKRIEMNNLLLAVPSNGLHSNGFSLVRRILDKKQISIKKNRFLKKELIKPTKIYVPEILKLIDKKLLNGCANITGGGIVENIKRIIPDNYCANINLNQIKPLKIFNWLKKNNVTDSEMLKTFNCGVGFCLIVDPKNLNKVYNIFPKNFKPYVIGKIVKSSNKVRLNGKINWQK
tara:strand:- start:642 stop:1244 length:603 start_codon:yes stop_codon:yes gene_type:complete